MTARVGGSPGSRGADGPADRWSNVVGIGTDLVDVPRFRSALERRARMAERLFTDSERAEANRAVHPTVRLAARFAAKEAVMKALGVGLGAFRFRDVEVVKRPSGAPDLVLTAGAAELAHRLCVREWRLSMTHTHTTAMAVALALG